MKRIAWLALLAALSCVDAKATSACLPPTPFPAEPPSGAQSASFDGVSAANRASFSATLWRQICGTEGATHIFLRITPVSGAPTICSAAFTIAQEEQTSQIIPRLLQAYGGDSFCGGVNGPTTFLVTSGDPYPPLDPTAALDFYFSGDSGVAKVSFPTFTAGVTPITPAVGLWWNPAESGTGYNFDVKHGVLVATIFSYKESGDSEWYIVSGPLTNNGRFFAGTLNTVRNGPCIYCPYQQPQLGPSGGPIKITFTSATSAVVTLPGGRVTNIQPQDF